jgi:hypothetical protein
MRVHARLLFGAAAAFNLAVGLALLFARGALSRVLKLDPIVGTHVVLANMCGTFIVLFGVAYALVARDPLKYRAYVPLGAAGKLLAVVAVVVPWTLGTIDATIPSLTAGDLVFALLFVHFLWRHSAAVEAVE